MMAKFKIIGLLLTLLILFNGQGSITQPPPVRAQDGLPVLAFYYAWFDQNTWTAGQSVDLPAEPYTSADRATIERQVSQAQGAGINGFVQSWYGPQEANNQTETNFRTLLDVGGGVGFNAAVDFEVTGPFFPDAAAVTAALQTLLTTHAQHPAYLRFQGKPVIFFWRQQRFSPEEWSTIRNQVDPDRGSFWIAEGVDIAYQSIFDGHHLYSIAWAASPAAELTKWGNRVRAFEAENQVDRLWVATTMPGYDDTRLPRDDAFAVPRQNGGYYRETWQGAVASQPDMIIITSFNEWPEGTHIEPSAGYGNFYLDVTRELVTALNGEPTAAPVPEPAEAVEADTAQRPASQQTQPAQPPEGPYIQTGSITNVRSGPSTDFERVGRLATDEFIPVIGKNEDGSWWLIGFEAAETGQGWVAAEVVDFVGESDEVPVAESPENIVVEPEVERPTVEIPPGGINVRAGPSLDFDLLGRLEEGAVVPVIGQSEGGDWWQIELEASEDDPGWITAALIDFSGDPTTVPVVVVTSEDDVFPTPIPTATVPAVAGRVEATDAVNVRTEPNLDAPRLGGLFLGETADVLAVSEDGSWWQIDYGGDIAWIVAEFVIFQGDRNSVPIFGLGPPTPTPAPTDTPGPPTPTPPPTNTPTPETIEFPPTFAPTATSVFEATAAAAVEGRSTPEPDSNDGSASSSFFSIDGFPWGIVAIVLVVGFFWFQLRRRRTRF